MLVTDAPLRGVGRGRHSTCNSAASGRPRFHNRKTLLIGAMACLFAAKAGAAGVDQVAPPAAVFVAGGAVDTSRGYDAAHDAPRFAGQPGRFVLQLTGPITPAKRADLGAAGVRLGDYLPDFAYIVTLADADGARLAALPFVHWIGAWDNAWKLDPELPTRSFADEARRAAAERGEAVLLVTLFAGEDAADVVKAAQALPGGVVHRESRVGGQVVLTVGMRLADAAALAELPPVQYIEHAPELTLRNSTTRWIIQSNVPDFTPLHDAGLSGAGQIVAIVDGRIDINHCSFFDTAPIGPTHRKILAYNTSTGSDAHGTHVAGTAVGDNGSNGDNRGIAFAGRLVFDTVPSYPFSESDMTTLLVQHHGQGAHIHTNSWGDDNTTSYNALARAVDAFAHDEEGDLVIFAETNLSAMKNPENAKNCLAVGATYDTPSQQDHYSGGVGPTADGRRKPELFAPGRLTTSSRNGSTTCATRQMSGTSMAAPAVAGVAMLVRQYYMAGYYPSGAPQAPDGFTPSAALIKATLLAAGTDMTGETGYPSFAEGWGRLLADDALYFAGDDRRLAVLDDLPNAIGRSTGAAPLTYPLYVTDSSQVLKVVLAWTDPPASASTGTGPAAINNLDLELVAPGGEVYLGNEFGTGGVSQTGGTADAINNVEQVHIASPALGEWTVRVLAPAVNVGTQGYALLATGGLDDDCNQNGLADTIDIVEGTSSDCDGDGTPDECQMRGAPGDNYEVFAACLTGPSGGLAAMGCGCYDYDGDDDVDMSDFVRMTR